jgi:hypothetical protein
MMIIRSAQTPADVSGPAEVADDDPLQAEAAQLFAEDLAACRIPSVRAIRVGLHIGQPRAQRVRAYLTAITEG